MAKTKTVSYSELDTYRQCPLKHQLGYKERWTTAEVSAALQKGKLMHQILELHYNRIKEGMLPVGIVQEIQTGGLLSDPDTGESSEIQDQVAWMYEGYVGLYGGDEPDWEVLDVELGLEEWLPTETGHRSSFRLKGKVDLLIRDHSAGGGLWIVDHKTGRNMPRAKDYDFDDQSAIYTYLLRRRGYDIRGCVFNFIRSHQLVRAMTPDERFDRKITVRDDAELERMAMEALDTMREAYRPRDRQAPRIPDPERCGWKCSFTEPCLAARKGRPIQALMPEYGFVVDLERH